MGQDVLCTLKFETLLSILLLLLLLASYIIIVLFLFLFLLLYFVCSSFSDNWRCKCVNQQHNLSPFNCVSCICEEWQRVIRYLAVSEHLNKYRINARCFDGDEGSRDDDELGRMRKRKYVEFERKMYQKLELFGHFLFNSHFHLQFRWVGVRSVDSGNRLLYFPMNIINTKIICQPYRLSLTLTLTLRLDLSHFLLSPLKQTNFDSKNNNEFKLHSEIYSNMRSILCDCQIIIHKTLELISM